MNSLMGKVIHEITSLKSNVKKIPIYLRIFREGEEGPGDDVTGRDDPQKEAGD